MTLYWFDESQFYMKRKKILQLSYAKTTLEVEKNYAWFRKLDVWGSSDAHCIEASLFHGWIFTIRFKPSDLVYLRKFEYHYWGESAGRRGPSEWDSYWISSTPTSLKLEGINFRSWNAYDFFHAAVSYDSRMRGWQRYLALYTLVASSFRRSTGRIMATTGTCFICQYFDSTCLSMGWYETIF